MTINHSMNSYELLLSQVFKLSVDNDTTNYNIHNWLYRNMGNK